MDVGSSSSGGGGGASSCIQSKDGGEGKKEKLKIKVPLKKTTPNSPHGSPILGGTSSMFDSALANVGVAKKRLENEFKELILDAPQKLQEDTRRTYNESIEKIKGITKKMREDAKKIGNVMETGIGKVTDNIEGAFLKLDKFDKIPKRSNKKNAAGSKWKRASETNQYATIKLSSLKPFSDQDYDHDSYTRDFFHAFDTDEIPDNLRPIQLLKSKIARELQQNVNDHYHIFIQASREIAALDSDIIVLGNELNELKSLLRETSSFNLSSIAKDAADHDHDHDHDDDDTRAGNHEDNPDVRHDDKHEQGINYTSADDDADNDNDELVMMMANQLEDYDDEDDEPSQERMIADDGGKLSIAEQIEKMTWGIEVAIAQRQWNEAVRLVEEGNRFIAKTKLNGSLLKALADTFSQKVDNLCEELIEELSKPYHSRKKSHELVSLLTRLGKYEEGRESFLEGRSEWLKSEILKIQYNGSVHLYCSLLCALQFQTIVSAFKDYIELEFADDPKERSHFISWMVRQFDYFAQIFRRQVFVYADDFQTIAECVAIMNSHSKQLEAVAIDFSFFIETMFRSDLEAALKNYFMRIIKTIQKSIAKDKWNGQEVLLYVVEEEQDPLSQGPASPRYVTSPDAASRRKITTTASPTSSSSSASASPIPVTDGPVHVLTDSVKKLFSSTERILKETHMIATLPLYSVIVQGTASVFDTYINGAVEIVDTANLNDKQFFSLIADLLFVFEHVIPRVSSEFKKKFNRDEIPELQGIIEKHEDLVLDLCEKFAETRAHDITTNKLPVNRNPNYPRQSLKNGSSEDVSRAFVSLFIFLSRMCKTICTFIRVSFVPNILTSIMEHIAEGFLDADIWDRLYIKEDSPLKLSIDDVNQLLLDLNFFVRAAETAEILSPKAKDVMNQITGEIVAGYCKANSMRAADVLHKQSWYESTLKLQFVAPELSSALEKLKRYAAEDDDVEDIEQDDDGTIITTTPRSSVQYF